MAVRRDAGTDARASSAVRVTWAAELSRVLEQARSNADASRHGAAERITKAMRVEDA
jgi:hypothetical protein